MRSEERRKELGTARRVREVRRERSSATVVVVRREEKSERSVKGDKRWVMLIERMGVRVEEEVSRSKKRNEVGVKWGKGEMAILGLQIESMERE